MTRDLTRLFQPKNIAVIGGGAWCISVIEQCLKSGFSGAIWPVHPRKSTIAGLQAYPTLADLPAPPDASFIGVNRVTTVSIVHELATINAGGAVCFASGFQEAEAEDDKAADLQANLLEAAGDMPILGPNCYGFINYLDAAILWPDQHGGQRQEKGVAIITQSSNMAINLTMQNRALPLAYMVTAGNQAQTSMAEIGMHVLADPRVTALGLHIEGFGDLRAFERLAQRAGELGKPIVALKVGKSQQARAATISHTASLAGSDAGAQAFLARLAIPRLTSLPEFLETLKLLHVCEPFASNRIGSISCSGGEASLAADTAMNYDVVFPPLNTRQKSRLRAALGPMVALANPLDYHTYIWRDAAAMTTAWSAMIDPSLAITLLIVDFPRRDRCDDSDWDCAITAALDAKAITGAQVAMVATLPELMPEDIAQRLIDGGVVPISGLPEAMAAIDAAVHSAKKPVKAPVLLPGAPKNLTLVSEAEAKVALAAFGVCTPNSARVSNGEQAALMAAEIGFPVVLKAEGVAHKTEAGAVALNLADQDAVRRAARAIHAKTYLVEQMIPDTIAELLIGVVRDPAHGFVLTLAAGGILTEVLEDSVSLLIPSSRKAIGEALVTLKISRLLNGYRGKLAASVAAIVDTVLAVQDYVIANAHTLDELEINPLLCCPDRAIAADALLRHEKNDRVSDQNP